MRRGVALESEHEHLALPDGLALEFLDDRLPGEELALRVVRLFDGVLKGFWGNLVRPASVARTLAALPRPVPEVGPRSCCPPIVFEDTSEPFLALNRPGFSGDSVS